MADIGCGNGGHAHFSANLGAKLLLADIDQAALQGTANLLSSMTKPPSFEAYQTDGASLKIADSAANRVVCTEVIEHVEDPTALMAELVRIGQPGALYLLSCPAPGAEAIFKRIAHPSYFERPNHIRIISQTEFSSLVESAGLIIERRLTRGFYQLLRMALFWGCPKLGADMRHPLLDSWAATWSLLLDQPNGQLIKNTLDDMLPSSQVIIARKP